MEAARKAESATGTGHPWLSLNKAAELRGKSRTTVLLEALAGLIRHEEFVGNRYFHRDDILKLKKSK